MTETSAPPQVFFDPWPEMADVFADRTERELFHAVLDIDEQPEVASAAFQHVTKVLAPVELSRREITAPFDYGSTALWESRLRELRRGRLEKRAAIATGLASLSRERCALLLEQYAPCGLLDGTALHRASQAATSHTRVATRLLSLFAHEIGDGAPELHHGNMYRELLEQHGLYLPPVTGWSFVARPEIPDFAFPPSLYALSLSHFPRVFLPELLGLTLVYYVGGLPPAVQAIGDRLRACGLQPRFFSVHEPRAAGERWDDWAALAIEATRCHLEDVLASDGPAGLARAAERVWRGVAAALDVEDAWSARALDAATAPEKTPVEAMLELVRRKAPYAHGNHKDNTLGGERIDDLLDPARLDPARVLEALAASPYVLPGDSKRSALFTNLLASGGRMFRIFSPEELKTIAAWIDSLPPRGAPKPPIETAAAAPRVAAHACGASLPERPDARALIETRIRESLEKYAPLSPRELYYHFVNVDLFPDVLPTAKAYASKIFERAAAEPALLVLPFFEYSPETFTARYEDICRYMASPYNGELSPQLKLLARAEVVRQITDSAPYTLIDGAWVQNMARPGLSHTAISAKLFHIYSDEVGNGSTELNHPNVARELLRSVGVELPAIDTGEFAHWSGFGEAAFDLPLLVLSMSFFPRHFLAEIIGFNLALEFSLIGTGTIQLQDLLRHHGIDPYYYGLHNTIDNASTGHSAYARDVVRLYMDQVFDMGGAELVRSQWRRVWAGLCSTQVISKTALALAEQPGASAACS